MTATTLTLLSPSPFKLASPFFDRTMDGHMDGMDYQVLNSMNSETLNNSSMGHPRLERRTQNLVLELDSLQTPDFRPEDKNPFAVYNPITPSSEFPTPTIQHLILDAQHPLSNVRPQLDALPEPVEQAQQEYRELNQQQQQHQQHQQQQQQPQLHEITEPLNAYYDMSQPMNPGSPGDSSSHSSSPSYSHDDHSGDQFSTSPGQQRSGSVSGMSGPGNYGNPGRKTGRPTKKQQYDQMVARKKEMEIENQKLKRRAEEYTLACKKLREKLLTLIQSNNRGIGQVM